MKDTDIEKKENNVKESADKKVKPDSNVPKPKLDIYDIKHGKITKLLEIANGLNIPNTADLPRDELIFAVLNKVNELNGDISANGILEIFR